MNDSSKSDSALFSQLSTIIEHGKQRVALQVNSTIVLTYWQIGNSINEHILHKERAEYGKEIVTTVATQLVEKYDKSFAERNLRRMFQFPDIEIVSHFVEILKIKSNEVRIFYLQEAIEAIWSKRELRHQIERINQILNYRQKTIRITN